MRVKGGKFSRRKGTRVEYEIRDYFRSIGYTADRVPSSGAAQGFKGDVRVISPEGITYVIEVKARAKGFEEVYAWFDRAIAWSYYLVNDQLISASFDFKTLLRSDRIFQGEEVWGKIASKNSCQAALKKLMSFKKWLKGSDFLVIKSDRKPPLFIKYE